MLKHTVTNCMLQHYYAPLCQHSPKDGYYYQMKNIGEQLVGNELYLYNTHCTEDVQYQITII